MNKSVLISIRPRWIDLIARGEKTIEVRKTRPKLDPPFKCYIYCTKAQNPVLVALQNLEDSPVIMTCGTGTRRYPVEDTTWARLLNGTVCGEFTCDAILPIIVFDNGSIQNWNAFSLNEACMSYEDMADYIGHGKQGYGWRISELKIYDEPRNISDFKIGDACPFLGRNGCSYEFHCFRAGKTKRCGNYLDKAPQSWCYVQNLED